MDQRQFIQWLESDEKLPASSVESLRLLTKEFPFFQSAHALLAKAMADNHDLLYDKHLKIAAAYSADRSSLYHLIHRKPTSIFISTPEKEEAVSPFILDKEEVAPQQKTIIPDAEANFQLEKEILPEQQPTYIFTPASEETILPAEPIEDPHEIIRRRLAEILGAPAEVEKQKPESIEQKEDVTKSQSLPVEMLADETIAPQVETLAGPSDYREDVAPKAEAIEQKENVTKSQSLPIETLADETIAPQVEMPANPTDPIEEVGQKAEAIEKTSVGEAEQTIESFSDSISPSEGKTLSTEEKISAAGKQAIDDVDKLQLEYALETTILSSLEHLPVLEKKPNIKEDSLKNEQAENGNFLQWLNQKKISGFGQVEEVHAYEENLPKENVSIAESIEKEEEKEHLIDRFIATEPRIVPSKAEFYSPASQAKKSITEHEDLVSETLAKIYLLQGHPLKARRCYEKLSLLQPEKKTYFAALIKDIDLQINNSENQAL